MHKKTDWIHKTLHFLEWLIAIITLLVLVPILRPIVAAEQPGLFRYIVLGVGTVMPNYLAISGVVTVILLLVGIMIFNKVERNFMDTV